MYAQEITFNHATIQNQVSPILKNGNQTINKSVAVNQVHVVHRLFYWYISPLTCELCHTLKCLIFHPINFAFALFLTTFDATMLSVGIAIIPVCCMGLPLLWVSMELIVAFSRIDLGFHYYMVETSKKLDVSRQHLLSLSLYFTAIPLCCNNQQLPGQRCVNTLFERTKFLFTNIEIYKYAFFHILPRPFIAFCTWWIVIIVAVNIGLAGCPIWYLVNDAVFVQNRAILGWADDCKWSEPNNGVVCDKDYVWIINTFGRAFVVGVVSLLALPLTLRLNNWFAELNKIVAYTFYTFYYTKDVEEIEANHPISTNGVRVSVDSV